MPIIAAFFGMVIRVFHADHPPPHVHVEYGEWAAIVQISDGKVLQGRLPPRLLRLLREWLCERRANVLRTWEDAQAHRSPRKVKPLE